MDGVVQQPVRLINGSELSQQIRDLFSNGEARLAVAFWGTGAADELGLTDPNVNGRIICNLRMGGTNPDEIQKLLDIGFQVRQCDTLHSKVYLGEQGAVIGSSNASANGLAFQGSECSGWIETNVYLPASAPHEELSTWFETFWLSDEVRLIDETDIEVARERWRHRRTLPLPAKRPLKKDNLLTTLKTVPERLFDRRIYITIYFQEASKEAERKFERYKRNLSGDDRTASDLGFWEDWDDLPDNSHLVSFFVDEDGDLTLDGIWHMPPQPMKIGKGRKALKLCTKSWLPYNTGSKASWRPIIRKMTEQYGTSAGIYREIEKVYEEIVRPGME